MPLPITSGYDTIYARSRVIAAANIAVWALHNSGDTPDSASRTIAYVNDINKAPAPNPLARKTIFSAGGHDAWTKAYDPDYRENGYNVYEWMLLNQKGTLPPPPNKAPVVNAGADKVITLPVSSTSITATASDSDGTIASYSWKQVYGPSQATITSGTSATATFSALVQGYYTFRVTASDEKGAKATDDVKVSVNPVNVPGTKYINVNVYGGANAYSSTAWNNWSVGTTAGTNKTSAAFKYSDGTASTVSAVLSATDAVSDNSSTYGSGMAPAEVLRYTSAAAASRTLTLNGLSASKTYNLQFFASRASSTAYSTIFTINGGSVTVNTYNNYTSRAIFNNVKPNTSGQIVITLANSNATNYLNGFTITENATTRFVKANIYGGTSAYNNVEWNNWNIGTVAATNKSSGALKYSDGTTSTAVAVLSATSAVSDNGTSYGSGMAPAEVLRFAGNHTAARTLTISGLSTAKKYNLELYASRSGTTTNNNTVFNVNGVSVSVNVNNNLTTKASYSNLVPNSSGQITVNISGTTTYNFLNGFILTEVSSTTALKASSLATSTASVSTNSLQKPAATSLSVFPNPAGSSLLLTISNSYTGAVKAQLMDETGRTCAEYQFVKRQAVLQQRLSLEQLTKGVYYITVQSGPERQSVKVSKQ